jgi:hypothetical protein
MLRNLCGAMAMAIAVQAWNANAAITVWEVQSASSSLRISGVLSQNHLFLAEISSQIHSPNGETAPFQGSITTSISLNGGNPAAIQFLSANLDPIAGGAWDPLPGGSSGRQAADYGVLFKTWGLGGINIAIRNMVADTTSAAIPLTGALGTPQAFAGDLDVALLSGAADFRSYGIIENFYGGGPTSEFIVGNGGTSTSAGALTISTDGLTPSTLTIPIDFSYRVPFEGRVTLDEIEFYFRFTGTITATTTEVIPEANSLVLLGLAGAVVGYVGLWRRERSSSR